MKTVYDALIIGGGPAGVSCAVWLVRLGFSVALVEACDEIGGLCRANPFYDEWNAASPGITGPQVADQLAFSLRRADVSPWLGCAIGGVHEQLQEGGRPLFTASAVDGSSSWQARYVVLATGVRARSLPGREDKWPGSTPDGLLIGPGEHIVAQDFGKKRVAVLGGGDNAFENALYALQHGARAAHVYARSVRAQHQFVRQLAPENLFLGDCQVDTVARTVNGRPYDLIMVFYGWEPCVGFADALSLQRTAQGFVKTDPETAETSCPRVYAVGEVAQRLHPRVVTALADGVTAAKAIQDRIESSGRRG